MRIVQVLGPSAGGIRRHVAVLSRVLAERGADVVVGGPPGVMTGLDAGGARVVDVPVGPVARLVAALVTVRRLCRGADVVHAHGLTAGWVTVLAKPAAPVVLTVHNLVLDEVAGRRAAVLRRLQSALARRVDAVIAVSPEIAVAFVGVPTEVILPVSDPPVPRRDRDDVRAELGCPPGGRLVVVVARLHPQKDLAGFVTAWADVSAGRPDARAAVVGDGPLRSELERAVARAGVAGTLRLAGPSPHAVDQIAAADVVASSSLWEGAPLVIAEAMQLGRAVVATAVGAVPDLLGDAGVLVPPGRPDVLAAALGQLLDAPERRAALGEAAGRRGAELFGVDGLVDAVEAVYRRVAS